LICRSQELELAPIRVNLDYASVRHPTCAAWLRAAQQKYGPQRIQVTTVTPRRRLAELWGVELPAWVTDEFRYGAKSLIRLELVNPNQYTCQEVRVQVLTPGTGSDPTAVSDLEALSQTGHVESARRILAGLWKPLPVDIANVLPGTRLGAKDPRGAHRVTTSCAPMAPTLHDAKNAGHSQS
jgi:hypothetical protein